MSSTFFSTTSILLQTNVAAIIILALYFVAMIAVAVLCRKKSATLDEFFLAGRGMGGWMTAFAYGTTYFSAVVFVGYAGSLGRAYGMSTVWIGIGNAVIGSLLAWLILARRTRTMTHNLSAKTMPEFFSKRYESSNLRLVSGLVIFLFLIPYSASVYQGLGYIFELVFNIKFVWCIIIMASITALYLFFGGYFATAVSDFVQGIIMLAGVVAMIAVLLGKADLSRLSEIYSGELSFFPPADSGDGSVWSSPMFNIFIMTMLTSLGICGMPQSVHKFYAIKDNAAIKKATIVSTLFALIIGGGAYFTGALTHLFIDDNRAAGMGDKLVPTMLSENLPAALLGLIVVLVLSASMSTLSSLSLTGASSVVLDVYKSSINKDADEKKVNLLLRLFCLLFVIMSAIFAIFKFQAIVILMGLSWGVLAGCFLGPYVYGLYSKKANALGAWVSIIACLVTTFILIIVFGYKFVAEGSSFGAVLKAGIGKSPVIAVICMAQSLILTPLASLIKSKKVTDTTVAFEGIE